MDKQETPIEDLSLPERVKRADAIKAAYRFQVNELVDARDTFANWLVARILKLGYNFASITYDGWAKKWNEDQQGLHKLLPYRYVTQQYSGQGKNAERQYKQYSTTMISQESEKIDAISKDIMSLDARQMTQYLRGELYILADFLMEYDFTGKESDLPIVNQLLKKILCFTITYMKTLPKYLQFLSEGQKYKNLYLADKRVAFAMSWKDIIELQSLYFKCPRIIKFYSKYDLFPIREWKYIDFPSDYKVCKIQERYSQTNQDKYTCSYINGKINKYGSLLDITEDFLQAGGLEATIELLEGANNELIPFNILDIMLNPFNILSGSLKTEVSQPIIARIIKLHNTRLEMINEKEIKLLGSDYSLKSFKTYKQILYLGLSKEESYKIYESALLKLCFKLFQSQSLEKQLKAINHFKSIADSISKEAINTMIYPNMKVNKVISIKSLSMNDFLSYLKANNFLQLVYRDSSHNEIHKRSTHIVSIMAKYNFLKNEDIKFIWEYTQEKHEEVQRVMYNSLPDICNCFSVEQLDYLFDIASSLPLDKYNDVVIQFAYTFTNICGAAKNSGTGWYATDPKESNDIISNNQNYSELFTFPLIPESKKYYFIPILYMLALESTNPKTATANLAVTKLIDILLKQTQYRAIGLKILKNCLHRISSNDTAAYCSLLAYKLLFTMVSPNDAVKLNDNYKIISSIANSIFTYIHDSNAFSITSEEQIVLGTCTQFQQISERMRFLVAMSKKVGKPIGEEILTKLLSTFLTSTNILINLSILRKVTIKESNNGESYSSVFNHTDPDTMLKLLSTNISTVLTYESLYTIFIVHFQTINIHKGALELRSAIFEIMDESKLVYTDELWGILANSKSEEILKQVKDFLCNMYLYQYPFDNQNRINIWKSFVDTCIANIKKCSKDKNEAGANCMIDVLTNFLFCFDGDQYPEDEFLSKEKSTSSVEVIIKPGNKQVPLKFTMYTKIGDLRNRIAKAFGFHRYDFIITNGKGFIYEIEDDNKKIRDIQPYLMQMFIKKTEAIPIAGILHPKIYLSQNIEYVELLFTLLSADSKMYSTNVWNLLSILPLNKQVEANIREFKMLNGQWDSLLDSHSIDRLKYALQIIEEIMNETDNESNVWFKALSQNGGLNHIIEILLTISPNDIANSIISKVIASLLKIITYCHINFFKIKEVDKIAEKILSIMDSFSTYWLQVESSIYSNNNTNSEAESKRMQRQLDNAVRSELPLIKNAVALLKELVGKNQEHLKYLIEYKDSKQLFLRYLLYPTSTTYLKSICKIFKESLFESSINNSNNVYEKKLLSMLIPEVGASAQEKYYYISFIKFITNLIVIQEPQSILSAINPQQILKELCDLLKSRTVIEKSPSSFDQILNGILLLLTCILHKFPENRLNVGKELGIIDELLNECLFNFPYGFSKSDSKKPPKCKSRKNRKWAHNLLYELCKECPENLTKVVNFLMPLHIKGGWRSSSYLDWALGDSVEFDNASGYVGIKNLGCICYMISLVQQLYMIPTFREGIFSVTGAPINKEPLEENMLYQFQYLLALLSESEKSYVNPKAFCKSMKNIDNQPLNLYEQMDADEFFNMLMDRLENQLKSTNQEQLIKDHFGGLYANQLICKECPHSSEREEPFIAINLQIKNKKNILQSLESLVEGEMLEGDNAYFCEKCDKKVRTLKRVCFKSLPKHLILVLKRFEFDYDTMQKVKLNDYCEFPQTLDMQPFTLEGLNSIEKLSKAIDEESTEEMTQQAELRPKNYYNYRLRGIVIHMGNSDSGHYYSLIQDLFKNWYEFNDCCVEVFNSAEIPQQAYGGEDRWSSFIGEQKFERIRNGYMLFYEREEDLSIERVNSTGKNDHIKDSFINKAMIDDILKDNMKYWENRYVFIREYFDFMVQLCRDYGKINPTMVNCPRIMDKDMSTMVSKYNEDKEGLYILYYKFCNKVHKNMRIEIPMITDNEEANALSHLMYRFTLTVYLTSVIRYKSVDYLIQFSSLIKSHINSDIIRNAQWTLEQGSVSTSLVEFFVECSSEDKRNMIAGIFIAAMYRLVDSEKELTVEKSYIIRFIHAIVLTFPKIKERLSCVDGVMKIFYYFLLLGENHRKYFIDKDLIHGVSSLMYKQEETNPHFISSFDHKVPITNELGVQRTVVEYATMLEEIYSKHKKREQIMQCHSTSYYMMILPLLVRCFDYQATSKDFNDTPIAIPPTSLQPYYVNPASRIEFKFILALYRQIHNQMQYQSNNVKMCYHILSDSICHMCFNHLENSTAVLNELCDQIKKPDEDFYKKHFHLVVKQFKIKDSHEERRCSHLMQQLLHFEMNPISLNLKISLIHRLNSMFPSVKEFLSQNKQFLVLMKESIAKHIQQLDLSLNQCQSKSKMPQHFTNFECNTDSLKRDKAYALNQMSLLSTVIENRDSTPYVSYDSDNDMASHKFKVGEKIEMKNLTAFTTVDKKEVVQACDEYIVVKKGKKDEWINTCSDNIGPDNSFSRNKNVLF